MDIEKLWREEIRDKKRIAQGARHRASRTGRIGTVLTPVDFLTGEDKREYQKPGKLEVGFFPGTIISWEQLVELSPEEQISILEGYREKGFQLKDILQAMGTTEGKYYYWIQKLGKEFRYDRRKKLMKKLIFAYTGPISGLLKALAATVTVTTLEASPN